MHVQSRSLHKGGAAALVRVRCRNCCSYVLPHLLSHPISSLSPFCLPHSLTRARTWQLVRLIEKELESEDAGKGKRKVEMPSNTAVAAAVATKKARPST